MKNLKTPLGIIGLIYILFGMVMNGWMIIDQWWPTGIFLIAVGIGIVLLFINVLTVNIPYSKLWQTLIGLAPIIAFNIMIHVNQASEDIFIIPEQFKGIITVVYGQENGSEKEFEDRKRLYRIPENGLLKTQFELKGASFTFGEYYFEANQGQRTKIESFAYDNPFPDSLEIYVHQWKFATVFDSNGNEFKYQQSTIGAKSDSFKTDILKLLEN